MRCHFASTVAVALLVVFLSSWGMAVNLPRSRANNVKVRGPLDMRFMEHLCEAIAEPNADKCTLYLRKWIRAFKKQYTGWENLNIVAEVYDIPSTAALWQFAQDMLYFIELGFSRPALKYEVSQGTFLDPDEDWEPEALGPTLNFFYRVGCPGRASYALRFTSYGLKVRNAAVYSIRHALERLES